MLKLIFSLLLAANICTLAQAQASVSPRTNVANPAMTPRSWQVCNETSYILNIVIASVFEGDDEGQLHANDWEKLRAGQCLSPKVKKGAPRYIYARSDPLHQGSIQEWKGHHAFCITPYDPSQPTEMQFSILPEQGCGPQNLLQAEFLRVLPTEKRTAFIEPSGYGKKSETAGLQRLLLDNNYGVKRIDGIGGRRTSNTLKAFLNDKGLKPDISTDAKLDALEAAALSLKSSIGVTLCNDSDARIWSALAWRTSQNWESQGWWPIEPKTCTHPFTRSLKDADVFLYARLETGTPQDLVLKSVSANEKSKTEEKEFCVGSSSFSAVSHEFCLDQGYVSAKFRPLPNNQVGIKLNLTHADFTKPSLDGLR